MRRFAVIAIGALVAVALLVPVSDARREAAAVGIRVVVRGLDAPVYVTAAPRQPGRLYVVEQGGRIKIVESGRVTGTFLDVSRRITSGGEQGLLGLAFHPDYPRNPRFYVNYTDLSGHTRVVQYRANGRRAIPSSARRLLLVRQPYSNHNGGMVTVGPDRWLYVGMGDGGSGGDPGDVAQNMGSRLGKLLRIDIDGGANRVLIAALGLRNPWRFSFDKANGALWIGDVGQGSIEEINYSPPGRRALLNFGWDAFEGSQRFEDTPLGPGVLINPVVEYDHSQGCSVTGGYVYRGSLVPSAKGRYFYGDYCSGIVWSVTVSGGKVSTPRREPFQVENLTSFGQDNAGEVYLVSHSGTIYRLSR